jgi:hypothetical protein
MYRIIRFVLTILLTFMLSSSFLFAAERPNLERVIETFIPIGVSKEAVSQQFWQDYLHLLRSVVAPLVRDLRGKGAIDWYCFLVHDRESGVPTSADDEKSYVHLRMSLTKTSDEAEFIKGLPSFCRFSRRMSFPNPSSLDRVDIQALAQGQVEQGWKILGESSEWVLKMLDAHDPGKPIPRQNVVQFLHYLGNQLLVDAVEIRMP